MKRWRVNYKEIIAYVVVFFLGVFLLQVMVTAQIEYASVAERMRWERMVELHIARALTGIFIGVLIKWRDVIKILQGNININLALIPGIAMGVASFFTISLIFFFGITHPVELSELFSYEIGEFFTSLFIAPFMWGGGIYLILSVASGVLIVEGLYGNMEYEKNGKEEE